MPKPFHRLLCISLLAALASIGYGDTVTLKNGEKLEGKVLEETETEVRMDVQETASISEERTFPKADVAKIEKTPPDETAWTVLKTFQLGPNSLPVAQYDRFIAPLKQFVAKFPQSAHIENAKAALAAFEEEKKRVEAKELKLDGKWLSKEEADTERYQINALLTLNYMRSEQARGDLISAMNAFDMLDQKYPNSKVFPDAVELAIKILGQLKAQAGAQLTALQAETVSFNKAISAAVEPARKQMREAAAQVRTANDQAMAAAQRQGLKWPPYLRTSDASMRMIENKATGELNRLSGLNLEKMRQSAQLTEKAKQQIADKDFTGAEASLNQARGLWDQNEMTQRYLTALDAAKTAAATAAAKSKATPAPVAAPEAIVKNAGAPAPSNDEPPANPWLKIVLGVIVGIMVIVGVTIYRNIQKKANEVLE